MRAFFYEQQTALEVAERFGYTVSAVYETGARFSAAFEVNKPITSVAAGNRPPENALSTRAGHYRSAQTILFGSRDAASMLR